MGFDVITALKMSFVFFWVVILCRLVSSHLHNRQD
jgi:hypothetical protein